MPCGPNHFDEIIGVRLIAGASKHLESPTLEIILITRHNGELAMNTPIQKHLKMAVFASATLLAATIITPQQAKADSTLITVLAGTALLGVIMHANQPAVSTNNHQSPNVYYHPQYAAPPQPTYPYQTHYAPVTYVSTPWAPYSQSPTYYIVR
jgi:hypothetical protein